MLGGAGYDGSGSVDVWPIGVLTYVLIFGRYPFDGENMNKVLNRIFHVKHIKLRFVRIFCSVNLHMHPFVPSGVPRLKRLTLFSAC